MNQNAITLAATYDVGLVILSITIAILAAYTALNLAGRVSATQGTAQKIWLTGGAIAMGIGIWSMHFVAMLAYQLPIPMAYDSSTVLLSVLAAVLASGLALFLVSGQQLGWLKLGLGSLLMGAGIASMHYIGMVAMRVQTIAHYDLRIVALSIGIAIVVSGVALGLVFHFRQETSLIGSVQQIGSAIIMGFAVVGMHYTGMAAVSYQPLPQHGSLTGEQGISRAMGNPVLAFGTVSATLFILTLAVAASLFDQWVHTKTAQAEALRQSEERFRGLVQNSSDVLTVMTADGMIGYTTSSVTAILGYETQDFLGKPVSEFVHPQDRSKVETFLKEALEHAVTNIVTEFQLRHADGFWLDFEVIANNLIDQPSIAGIVITCRNITQRKRTEEALHLSVATNRALLDAMPDLMVRLSKDGTFINYKLPKDMNLPVPASEFLGKTLYEVLLVEVAQPAIDCIERALQTSNVQLFEFQLLANSNLRDYEARIVVSARNEVIAIVRDITERKRAEADIRNALEKEKELSELKSSFVTMASHEFRTPLATILSSTELLEHYSHKWGEEKKLTHFQRIEVAVKHMTGLLNDVLLIGKAEAGKLEFKPTPLDLGQFCCDLMEEMQTSSSSHSIDFCSQGQCQNAVMDEKLLRHVLSNLLSNAIKYSPQGGTVHFDLICNLAEATFHIRDKGIGIPPADQAQLFNSFHRASNVGAIAGTGLGLAIVKKSVEVHGGQIEVESHLGVGTTFTVTLPLNKQVQIEAAVRKLKR